LLLTMIAMHVAGVAFEKPARSRKPDRRHDHRSKDRRSSRFEAAAGVAANTAGSGHSALGRMHCGDCRLYAGGATRSGPPRSQIRSDIRAGMRCLPISLSRRA
jgi:hypothetical protein